MAQREMGQSLVKMAFYLTLIFSVHILAMQLLENMSLSDSIWLTLSTVTTVGYGDLSASTPFGRTATVVFIYMGGIFVLAKIAGDYFDYRSEIRLQKIRGEWDWDMQKHILIVNTPAHYGEQYLSRLIQRFRETKKFQNHSVQILTASYPGGLPDRVTRLGNVVHYHGGADDPETLMAVNAQEADVIVVLAKDEHDPVSDSLTFDILHRFSEISVEESVLAECVDDRNQDRLLKAGAHFVIRPMRAYPGMIVRAFVAPGSEQIIENMFTSTSDEYQRFDFPLSGKKWKDIVCLMINNDLGTAVAYIGAEDGSLHCNPPAHTLVNASALILMVREDSRPNISAVESALRTVG